MSKGHAQTDIAERSESQQQLKQEIQGRLPKGPFEFSESLDFAELQPKEDDEPSVARYKLAVLRDARYATTRAPCIQVFGLSQGIRSIYTGGIQLIDGGAE